MTDMSVCAIRRRGMVSCPLKFCLTVCFDCGGISSFFSRFNTSHRGSRLKIFEIDSARS